MRIFVSALAIAAAAVATMPASAKTVSAPATQIENITVGNLSGVLTELGAQQIETSSTAGSPSVRFRDGNIPFHMVIAGCDQAGGNCIATVMLVVIDGGTANYPLDAFNSFNRDNTFVSAVKLEDNKFAVTRMIVTSGGISKQNLAVNIANFAQAPNEIIKYLSSQLVAGYQDGRAAQFQRAGMGWSQMPRAVYASPRDIARVMSSIRPPVRDPALGRR